MIWSRKDFPQPADECALRMRKTDTKSLRMCKTKEFSVLHIFSCFGKHYL